MYQKKKMLNYSKIKSFVKKMFLINLHSTMNIHISPFYVRKLLLKIYLLCRNVRKSVLKSTENIHVQTGA